MLYVTNIIPFYLGHTKWQRVTADFILMAQKIMIIGDVWQPSGKNSRFLLSKHFLQHHIQPWPISRQKFCSWWFSNIQSWRKSFQRHHSFWKDNGKYSVRLRFQDAYIFPPHSVNSAENLNFRREASKSHIKLMKEMQFLFSCHLIKMAARNWLWNN